MPCCSYSLRQDWGVCRPSCWGCCLSCPQLTVSSGSNCLPRSCRSLGAACAQCEGRGVLQRPLLLQVVQVQKATPASEPLRAPLVTAEWPDVPLSLTQFSSRPHGKWSCRHFPAHTLHINHSVCLPGNLTWNAISLLVFFIFKEAWSF